MHTVFVYGSLKRGFPNSFLLRDSEFQGLDTIRGTMYSLGAFPAVTKEDTNLILGEVYEVDDATLERLDMLEGHPRFYCREEVTTGGRVRAWVYLLPQDKLGHSVKVESGVWE